MPNLAKSLVAAGALVLAAASPVAADPPATGTYDHKACFYTSDFDTWKAPDEKTIYIRVHPDRYFRLDLSKPCPVLMYQGAHLITTWRSSNWVCNAIDWDLKVSQAPTGGGATMACIVSAMTPMSPAEVDAIPKKYKP